MLILQLKEVSEITKNRLIKIPVFYYGPDLEYISKIKNIPVEEIIRIHANTEYRVFMIGFLPGFAYMGTVDERIAAPRKEKPALHVKPGSVGIAGMQTGIYPIASPGGWQLIGTTPLKIFNKEKTNPCLFAAGDRVQFFPINKNEFDQLNEY